MKKTTIWLTPEDVAIIDRIARAQGRTRSEVIRDGIRRLGRDLIPNQLHDLKPAWSLQPIFFELMSDRERGIPTSETARRLGFTEEQMANVAADVERRFAPLPEEPSAVGGAT
jgi:hypothetical protein